EAFVAPLTGATPRTSRLVPFYGQAESGRTFTVFVQDAWRPASRLTLTPGLRLTNYDLAGETWFDPRVSVTYQLTPTLQLLGNWSLDHQAASRVQREDLVHGDSGFWVLADGVTVPVTRANRLSGGASYQVPGVVFDIEGYYRTLDDVPMFAPRLYPGRAPAPGQALFHAGTGKALGIEASVLARNRINTLVASYAGGRIEYTFPTLEAATFRASHDRQHEFKVADIVRFGGRFAVAAAWTLASGRPYTPAQSVDTVWFPEGASVYSVVFGEKNSATLPAYHRLDLSGQGEFRLGRVTSTLGMGVFNLYDRQNSAYYDNQVVGKDLRVYDVLMMGRAYNFYVRVAF
ncbi:MAG: TonB-dependent receptor, partial [Vicinamibacterales bacterium]|nr:TonB-dependent receptor [Vicinamibacterales bacterium]